MFIYILQNTYNLLGTVYMLSHYYCNLFLTLFPMTIKKRCCSLHSQQHASRDITNEQQKKPAVNDRLVKCNTLKGHLKSYDICFYIIPANTDAPITVSNPATAMARLLMAPSTGPSSMALAVPIAWADVPSPRPLAIGSSIFAIL